VSLDLYQDEAQQKLAGMRPVTAPETGVFDGFVRGSATYAMKGLAKTARAIDMAGAVFPMAEDAISGGTTAQDRYFREHDDVFGSAVDFWTPKPNEVGVAAEVFGGLVGQLPIIMASPHLAVGAQVLDTAEDLTKSGVDATRAVAAGVVQGAGLATGIWMPILGQNGWQRIVLGGAGFNALQGATSRALTSIVLQGTSAEEAFKAFDPKAITLDVLLGAAFGTLAHLSPAQREQGAQTWKRIENWAENLSPSEVGALATLRTAQHLNEDSAPGKVATPEDVEAHAARVRQAVDQLVKDQPVEVNDLAAPEVKPDDARFKQAAKRAEALTSTAERVAKAEGLPAAPEIKEAATEVAATETEGLAAKGGGAEPPPPRGESAPSGQPLGQEKASPLELEAKRIADEQPDLQIITGHDTDGKPMRQTAKEFLEQTNIDVEHEQSLIRAAAACLLGVA
jgi:hypothetical protein